MSEISTIKIAELVVSGEVKLQTGPFGTQLKASDYVAQGTPVINVRNVGFGDIRKSKLEYLDERMVYKLSAHLLERNDIIFGQKGAVERHAFICSIGEGWIQGADCLRLRIKSERISNRFVSYYFRTQSHQDWMQAVCSFGATMASLNQNIVKLITLPLPSKDVQNKIVGMLSAYDYLIENNKRRISLLEKMAEEIYREWFVRFRYLGYQNTEFEKGIPNSWPEIPISEFVDFKSGFAFKSKKYEPNSKYGIVTIKNVHNGKFISDCSDYITEPPSNLSEHHFIKTGDILMSLTGNVGRVCVAYGRNLLLNQRVALLKPKIAHHSYYIYWLFRQKSMMTFCEMISTGTAQQNLSPIKLGAQKLFYPENKLIKKYQKIVSPLMDQIFMLQNISRKLEKTKNMLLPRVISGKLSVENLDTQFPPSMQQEMSAVVEV